MFYTRKYQLLIRLFFIKQMLNDDKIYVYRFKKYKM